MDLSGKLERKRQSSPLPSSCFALPLAVFVLRTSPSQAGSLVDPFAAQLACRGEISEMPHGILSLRYNQCRNGFRLLRQRECKRNGSWTSAEIFQNNVCGSAVPCCPASSATADYAAAVFPVAVFVLRSSPRQAGSLVDPFAAQLACRGEISALPR